jgi:uncharacterized membrane protein SpoIIM required for sporulation/uncharacterized RDD family membrane protein YckC
MDERVSIITPDHIELDFEPAGLGSRLLAAVIDALIIVAIFVVLLIGGILAGVSAFGIGGQGASAVFIAALVMLLYAVVWGYFVFFEALERGRTPGKRVAGIRVVLDNGLPVGWRESALRNLVRAADIMPPPACLVGSLMILFSKKGKRLGDLLAGTMVVRETFVTSSHPRGSRWETAWVAGAEQGKTRRSITLGDMKVDARQIQIIERFLAKCDSLPLAQRQTLAWRIASPFLQAAGEDPRALVQRSDRFTVCEQVLRSISQQANAASEVSTGGDDAAETKRKQWREFDKEISDLHRYGKNGLRRLRPDQMVQLIEGYHRLAGDLARARAIGRQSGLVRHLNDIAIRAHNIFYSHIKVPKSGSEVYWGYRFPIAVRRHIAAVIVSAVLTFFPSFVTFAAVQFHPDLGYDLVPDGWLEFEPARQESLHTFPEMTRPLVASGIISNNIQVTLFAFGLGLTAGLGTTFLLVSNGVQIGAIGGWLTARGNGRAFWGWIMPHGGTELLAVVLAGAAGLILARAIIAPGEMRRGAALRKVAMDALVIELGVMAMLVFAGLIEGFVSPSSIGYGARVAVLITTLAFWFGYLGFAGRHVATTPTPDRRTRPAANNLARSDF